MTVYLCGPINGCTDAEAQDWRAIATKVLASHHVVLDPMRRDYRGREDAAAQEIVAGDLADIAAADVVLAMALRPTWGTAMEIYHAAMQGKRVVAVVGAGPQSPWLTQHCTVTHGTLDAALDSLGGAP
jgi:nucleoside 2-deoxyribosyltransferase